MPLAATQLVRAACSVYSAGVATHLPMTRVQILLPDELDRRLEGLAARRGQSKAHLVREALELLFRAEPAEGEPLLDLIGQASAARRQNASHDHDRILSAAERHRNRRE